jgi:hypothetical protein
MASETFLSSIPKYRLYLLNNLIFEKRSEQYIKYTKEVMKEEYFRLNTVSYIV